MTKDICGVIIREGDQVKVIKKQPNKRAEVGQVLTMITDDESDYCRYCYTGGLEFYKSEYLLKL